MDVPEIHEWDVSPSAARQIQDGLRGRVTLEDGIGPQEIRTVAGADVGYSGRGVGVTAFAAVLTFSFPDLEIIETQIATATVDFPYVPGLLSFREGPALLAAFRKVRNDPDVILFDAQGIAHPRRLGAASHLGVLLDKPSIGCAKSRLVGRYEEPGPEFGCSSPLVDGDDVLGAVVRTRTGRAPLFVSPGHKVSTSTAVEIVLACCRNNRFMPEPTRLADKLVRETKRTGV